MSNLETIDSSDALETTSRGKINDNFSNLNTDKVEIGGVNGTPARGDIFIGKNASPIWGKLVIGSANKVLTSDGSDPSWNKIVNNNVDDAAGIVTSKLALGALSGSSLMTWLATGVQVISLAGVSTTGDTDVDLTANTHASATHVILMVNVDNSNTSEGSFVTFRAKGATASDAFRTIVYAPTVNGFHARQQIIVPCDSEQRITYSINSNAGATGLNVYVMGYFRALPA